MALDFGGSVRGGAMENGPTNESLVRQALTALAAAVKAARSSSSKGKGKVSY